MPKNKDIDSIMMEITAITADHEITPSDNDVEARLFEQGNLETSGMDKREIDELVLVMKYSMKEQMVEENRAQLKDSILELLNPLGISRIKDAVNSKGQNLAHLIYQETQEYDVIEFLKKNQVDFTARDLYGNTPGDIEKIEGFCQTIVDYLTGVYGCGIESVEGELLGEIMESDLLNRKGVDGRTMPHSILFFLGERQKNPEYKKRAQDIISLLVSNGVNLDIADDSGQTARNILVKLKMTETSLNVAVSEDNDTVSDNSKMSEIKNLPTKRKIDYFELAMQAIAGDDFGALKIAVLSDDSIIKQRDESSKMTLLHQAVALDNSNRTKMVALLLGSNADLEATDINGLSCAQYMDKNPSLLEDITNFMEAKPKTTPNKKPKTSPTVESVFDIKIDGNYR